MNQYSLPILVIASISFYVGIYHLMLYFRDRQIRRDLVFALLCFTTTLYDIFCIGLYHVTSVAAGVHWQRNQMIALAFVIIFFVWFVADYTHYERKRLVYAITVFFLLTAVVQLIDRSNLTWILDQPAIKIFTFPSGYMITYYEAAVGPITLLENLMGFVWGVFIIVLGIRFYQRGFKQEAIPLIIAMVIMYFAMANDIAVSNEWYSFIYTIEYAYPIMILLMAFSLTRTYGDIHLSQNALRESDIRFHTVIDTSPDGFLIANLKGKILGCNQRELELLGYEKEEDLIGTNGFDLIDSEDLQRAQQILEILTQSGIIRNEVITVRKKDGGRFIGEVSTSMIINAEGKPVSSMTITRDITDRTKAEKALQASEAKYRTLFETSPVGQVVTKGLDVLLCNEAESHLYGYDSPQEMMGRPITDFVHPDDYPKLLEIGRSLNKGNIMNHPESFRGLHKERTPLILETFAIPFPWEGEDTLLSFHMDVTARKQAEEALAQERRRLAEIIKGTNAGTWEWNVQTGETVFNDRFAEIVGYTLAELSPVSIQTWKDLAHPDDLIKSDELLEKHFKGELDYYECEARMHHKDGSWVWILDRGCVHTWTDDGKPLCMSGTHQDITKRKRAEEALRKSEERFRTVVESSPVGFFIANNESMIEYANKEMSQIMGYPLDEIINHDLHEALDDKSIALVRERYFRRLKGEDVPKRYEFGIIRKDGERRLVELAAALIEDSAGIKKVMGQMIDITERKQAEEEILRLNEELEQRVINRTQQLESANSEMEAFTYSVSHDLRAPLRAIDGYARIILEDYAGVLDKEGQRLFSVIRDNSRRMSQLIDDLLAFSRLNRAELKSSNIDMSALANAVFLELTPPAERERIEIKITPLESITGDPILMRQVWSNLIANAIKFSSKRTLASIEIGCTQKEVETVYYIRDNGAGFDMHYAHQLFGVFHRLHNEKEFEGTGVGLAIVQRVIQRHSGRVWGKGEVDKGATFYFALPRKEAP